jgi:hypothetical protein
MPRRPRLRIAGAPDPTDIFNDLDALRRESQAAGPRPAPTRGPPPVLRRQRSVETFARIPHDRARALYGKIDGLAWALLIELDCLLLTGLGRNPVKLSSTHLQKVGLNRMARWRGLRRLEAAGVIRVERQGKGRPPWVTHLWFPRQD